MAAAEYFAPGPLHGQSAAHPQQTQAAASPQQLQPTSNYSSSPNLRPQQGGPPPPPPYSPFEEPQRPRPQGVHFAPTPPQLQQHHQRHSFSDQHRPSIPQSSSAHQMYNHPQHQNSSYPVVNYNASSANLHAPYPQSTSQYNGSSMNLASYYPPQPQKQYYTQQSSAPHMRPYGNANYSTTNLMGGNQPVQGGYTSDPEPHRRRRRRRSHEDKHKRDRSRERDAKDSRSTKKDATVGAVAGGLIGDLIFPGLGSVVAGAGLGWLGGKDYGKHRKWREEKLEKEQKQWEDKYRKSSRDEGRESHRDRRRDHDDDGDFYYGGSRSRGHSDSGYRGRESSYSQPPPQFLGEKGRTQSYERRNSHY